MATATLGKVEEFDQQKEEWTKYVERLGYFFYANSIMEARKKQSILLSVMGAATYKVVCRLISPDKPRDKTYEELLQK